MTARALQYLHDLLEQHGIAPVTFHARPGDLLFWHGDFVHAGGAIHSPAAQVPTRKSLVCHDAVVPDDMPSLDPVWVKRAQRGGAYYQKVALLPADAR